MLDEFGSDIGGAQSFQLSNMLLPQYQAFPKRVQRRSSAIVTPAD
jgi:hypothetical protein